MIINFVIPEASNESTTDGRNLREVDTLVVVDSMALGLKLFRGKVFQLTSTEGYRATAELMVNGKLLVNDYKFIVLLVGRADLAESDREFRSAVGFCLQTIRELNGDAIVMLCAVLPSPQDSRRNIKIINERNGYLSMLASEDNELQFAKPGKGLFVYGGPAPVFYNDIGGLNPAGLELVKFGLENKFRCASLRARNH